MSTAAPTSTGARPQRDAAVLRLSEALSVCHEPGELAKVLAEQLSPFLRFDYLDIVTRKENSAEIEWHAWGTVKLPVPDLQWPPDELADWPAVSRQELLYVADLKSDERFPCFKQELAARGIDLGSLLLLPLTTPHRRLGVLGIASASAASYSDEDIVFLQLVARVVAFAIDDGLNLRRERIQNDRLELLLNLTNRITSNLELREVLRAVAVNVREVMHCDMASIALPGDEPGTLRVYALDFPEGKGAVKEELVVGPSPDDPGWRAIETLQPVIWRVPETGEVTSRLRAAVAEGIKTICFIPLVSRGRALATLAISRRTDSRFTSEDVEFLNRVAGQIAIAIENALAYEEISELKDKLTQEKLYLEDEIRSQLNFENVVGNSSALQHVLSLVETVAFSDATVLLLGETGTGKELIARAIHDRSRRRERTFAKLNCAAIPAGLLESELFGHKRGAFTGAIAQKAGRLELADQGTLFLDEVGDIPVEVQPKLLRVLQEREFERLGSTHTRKVDFRLVSATNRDLEQMVASREFRSDLFYRLSVFPIRIPPLRERKEDIPLLVSYFVQKFAKQMHKNIEGIPASAMKGLTAWDWPGNIRELENFIERAVILTRGKSLEAPLAELRKTKTETAVMTVVPQDVKRATGGVGGAQTDKDGVAKEYETKQREEIIRALTACKGRVGGSDGAASRLGINRTTLLSRMKKLGVFAKQYA
nr:putative transcription factor [uncultured bacterium]